ncbi:uncharacterized protein LOC126235345 [Schistocerca nitens]|uniref:uncharacterized protein LOC126235345 n=1 Tax=Schistocerca nitens TaxID=7011 RepID=UPI0021173D48|nr:uncharacterized protein LOC126235345 [Schistocerca nitens]
MARRRVYLGARSGPRGRRRRLGAPNRRRLRRSTAAAAAAGAGSVKLGRACWDAQSCPAPRPPGSPDGLIYRHTPDPPIYAGAGTQRTHGITPKKQRERNRERFPGCPVINVSGTSARRGGHPQPVSAAYEAVGALTAGAGHPAIFSEFFRKGRPAGGIPAPDAVSGGPLTAVITGPADVAFCGRADHQAGEGRGGAGRAQFGCRRGAAATRPGHAPGCRFHHAPTTAGGRSPLQDPHRPHPSKLTAAILTVPPGAE